MARWESHPLFEEFDGDTDDAICMVLDKFEEQRELATQAAGHLVEALERLARQNPVILAACFWRDCQDGAGLERDVVAANLVVGKAKLLSNLRQYTEWLATRHS